MVVLEWREPVSAFSKEAAAMVPSVLGGHPPVAFAVVQQHGGITSPQLRSPPPLASLYPPRSGSIAQASRRGRTQARAKETLEEEAARRGGGRGTKGLYVRPSKALEIGGGFYVPGLEGYKFRVAVVGLVLTLLTLNRLLLPGYQPLPTQVVSEVLTILTAIFVLLQALGEAFVVGSSSASTDAGAAPPGDGVVEGAATAPEPSALSAAEVYVSPDVTAQARERLEWLVGAALQAVQAGSCTCVLGTRGRVAVSGAGSKPPSPEQRDAALAWAARQGGVVKTIARSGEVDGGVVMAALPAGVQSALVAVADAGDLMLVVGLGGITGEWADENGKNWLKALADVPFE